MDDIEDEEMDDLQLPSTPGASSLLTPTRKSTCKLPKPKEKPRETQLEYQKSLPYVVEGLEEMDGRLEEIVRRLVDCVQAKD